jgi:hypothetical protein
MLLLQIGSAGFAALLDQIESDALFRIKLAQKARLMRRAVFVQATQHQGNAPLGDKDGGLCEV